MLTQKRKLHTIKLSKLITTRKIQLLYPKTVHIVTQDTEPESLNPYGRVLASRIFIFITRRRDRSAIYRYRLAVYLHCANGARSEAFRLVIVSLVINLWRRKSSYLFPHFDKDNKQCECFCTGQ